MYPAPLNYEPSKPSRLSRTLWRQAVVIGLVVLVVAAMPGVTVRKVESRIDEVTGSMSWENVWIFGITSGPRITPSSLETRLKQSGISWTPRWHTLHNTHRNIFGSALRYDCSSAPPIFEIRLVLREFATTCTDDDLREFVRVMQSGTESEQKAAVDAANEKALTALAH